MELLDLLYHINEWSFATVLGLVQLVGEIVGLLHIPSVLLRRSDRPMAQLTWILCLISLPFLGVMLWWMIGRNHLHRKRRARAAARAELSKGLVSIEVERAAPLDGPAGAGRQALLVDDNEIFPTTGSNRVEILVGGTAVYAAFEEAIRNARHSVHLAFYIWKRDHVGTRLRDLLAEKAREGVEVRLLFDAWGASSLSFGHFMDPLRAAGARVEAFLPLRVERQLRVNFRNHRKIVICDGEIGFTGGINVGDEYNDWYDMAVRVQGPVVNQLQEVFAEDWFFAAEENLAAPQYFNGAPVPDDEGGFEDVIARVIASGPDSWRTTTHTMFFLAITNAKDRIWITTPYFIPDQAIMTALRTASMRGVDVRLLLPGRSDVRVAQAAGRGYFEELLEAGVQIWEYQPHVLHAKILIFDDFGAIVGSANMDTRSFRLQFEVNLAVDSHEVNQALCDEFLSHLEDADPISAAAWAARPRWAKLGDAAARLMSPVL